MNKRPIDENEFSGAPSGVGSANYAPTYGTFASPAVSQNPNSFQSSNDNKALGANSNTAKEGPDSGSMQQDLNVAFSKKPTPTPDEVVCGIKFELGQMVKKDKRKAKELVIANLRKDPKFYSGLKMLGIDDVNEVNNMNENIKHPNDNPATSKVNVNIAETKKIFEQLADAKDHKYVVNSNIVDVMKELQEQKKQRNAWRNGESK